MTTEEKSGDFLEYLKDPIHVWNFQKYFGVQKVRVVETQKGTKFQARNIDDVTKKIQNTPQKSRYESSKDFYLKTFLKYITILLLNTLEI